MPSDFIGRSAEPAEAAVRGGHEEPQARGSYEDVQALRMAGLPE
jgi:hypothetical protein